MSLLPSVVAGGGILPADYYFALSSDPGLKQTLDLSGNILSISGGNSVDVAAATTVSTSAVKLTAQTYNTGFNQTEFTGNIVGLGEVTSLNLLGSSAVLDGGQAQVRVVDSVGTYTPTIKFEKPLTNATITYDGTRLTADKDIRIDGDLQLKGANGSVDFYNSSNVQKAALNYAELTDKVTMVAANVVLDTTSAGYPRVILEGSGLTVRTDDLPVKLERYDATGSAIDTELALSGSGTVALKASVSAANPTLKLTNTDTSISASLNYDGSSVNLKAPDVPLYLTKTDSLGAAETSVIVSASGNVLIEAATPTLTFSETATPATATVALSGTTLTATSDSVVLQNTAGNVKLEVVDSALNNVIVMSANGGVNRLSVFGAETYIGGANPTLRFNNDSSATQADIAFDGATLSMTPATGIVEIVGDTTTATNPTVRFTDTSTTVPTVNMSVSNDGFGFGYSQLGTTAGLLSASSGAVEGVAIGTNGTENVVIGYGLPLRIGTTSSLLPTDYISVEDTGSGGRAKIVQTNEVNIETPLLSFTGAGLQSNTASGTSGEHLVITLNGVVYKIKLENA